MIYQFRIELKESNPLVWREIAVPEACTLYQLHMLMQASFGWTNSHLFQFSEKGLGDKKHYGVPYEKDDLAQGMIDAKNVLAKTLFKKEGDVFIYVYDFGDHWVHSVKLIARIDKDDKYCPVCTGGGGACPPEDVGGIHGYQQMLIAMKALGGQEKKSFIEWLGLVPGEKWDAEFCSTREANKRIAMLVAEF
jgi:hypothetical protein